MRTDYRHSGSCARCWLEGPKLGQVGWWECLDETRARFRRKRALERLVGQSKPVCPPRPLKATSNGSTRWKWGVTEPGTTTNPHRCLPCWLEKLRGDRVQGEERNMDMKTGSPTSIVKTLLHSRAAQLGERDGEIVSEGRKRRGGRGFCTVCSPPHVIHLLDTLM